MKKVNPLFRSRRISLTLLPRFETIFGNSLISNVSTRMGRKPNPRVTIYGTSMQKNHWTGGGSSDPSIANWPVTRPASPMSAFVGPGLRVFGTLKRRRRIFPYNTVLPRYPLGSHGRTMYFLALLPLTPRAVKSLQMQRFVFTRAGI